MLPCYALIIQYFPLSSASQACFCAVHPASPHSNNSGCVPGPVVVHAAHIVSRTYTVCALLYTWCHVYPESAKMR